MSSMSRRRIKYPRQRQRLLRWVAAGLVVASSYVIPTMFQSPSANQNTPLSRPFSVKSFAGNSRTLNKEKRVPVQSESSRRQITHSSVSRKKWQETNLFEWEKIKRVCTDKFPQKDFNQVTTVWDNSMLESYTSFLIPGNVVEFEMIRKKNPSREAPTRTYWVVLKPIALARGIYLMDQDGFITPVEWFTSKLQSNDFYPMISRIGSPAEKKTIGK